MKRKRIASKLLSVILSAAVVVSSSFSGVTLFDVSATELPAVETTSESIVSDNTTDEVPEVAEDEETPDVSEETQEEDVSEEVQSEESEQEDVKETSVEDDTEDSDKKKIEMDDVDPESAVKESSTFQQAINEGEMNEELAEALLSIYNAEYSEKTLNTLTFSDFSKITLIELPASITNCKGIGHVVKYGTELRAVTIDLSATKVTEISDGEFSGGKHLVTVRLPEGLTGIGQDAFKNCENLVNVYVGASGDVNTLPTGLVSTKTRSNIFSGCHSLTEFTLPSFQTADVLSNAAEIFSDCIGLEEVTISAGVSVLPVKAFYGAGKKTGSGMTVNFATGSQMSNILTGAFQYVNMAEIDLSNCKSLKTIGDEAFSIEKTVDAYAIASGPHSAIPLSKVVMPDLASGKTMTFGEKAFFGSPVTTMGISGKVTDNVVAIPDYVTSMGTAAFYYNTAMTSLKLPLNLDAVKEYTFDGCGKLNKVDLNSGTCKTKYIGNAAFRNTTALTDANFLAKMGQLVKIGEQKLTATEITGGVNTAHTPFNKNMIYGSDVFYGSGITSASFPASLRIINSRSFYAPVNGSKLTTVTWATDASTKQIFEINSEAFARCSVLTSFVYPKTEGKSSTLAVENLAFAYCSALTMFKEDGASKNGLPATLTKLGQYAFMECSSLPSMHLKDKESGGAPEIGNNAFEKCYALAEVTLPSSLKAVPDKCFYDCGLTSFPKFSGSTNALESIGNLAFFGSKMKTVDLSSLTKLEGIGSLAFAYYDTSANAYNPVLADEVDSETKQLPADVGVQKVILPKSVSSGEMTWGNNMLHGATNFTTMSTPSSGTADGIVYIPNYIKEAGCGAGVFAGTAVSAVKWGYQSAGSSANKWTAIPAGMFFNTNIKKVTDACVPAADLKEIGASAYSGCYEMTEVDLSGYPNLETIGRGAFQLCCHVETVKLPKNGKCTKVPDYAFHCGSAVNQAGVYGLFPYALSSITSIDFGTVTEIGDWAFATYDAASSTGALLARPSSLVTLDLTGKNVEKIGNSAFKGNNALKTLKLGNVKEIGISSFEQCVNLNLTSTPLPNGLQKIGDMAFYKDASLGKVTFGSGLVQIGAHAFAECANITVENSIAKMEEGSGLTEVDFSKAQNLTTIGQNAFAQTALEDFDISDTAVTILNPGTLYSCPYLRNAAFGPKLQRITGDSMAGCVRLNGRISFYSTTTVDKTAFYSAGVFVLDPDVPVELEKFTPIGKTTISVVPVELNVGIGKPMKFPYYVSAAEGNSAYFKEMWVGSAESKDKSAVEYIKVYANTAGYYVNSPEAGNLVQDSRYFEKVTDITQSQYVVNGVNVFTFDIEGLKATPANKTIPFFVTNGIKFVVGSSEVAKEFTTQFNMKVTNIPYYVKLYKDQARTLPAEGITVDPKTGIGKGDVTIRVNAANPYGNVTYYYDIEKLVNTNWQPPNGNLIVKTSNPEVVAPVSGAAQIDSTTWKVTAEYPQGYTQVSDITYGKGFIATVVKNGDAVLTVYPEGYPNIKTTINVHARLDIADVGLAAPQETWYGVQLYQKFSILNAVALYKNILLSREKGDLNQLSKYTDNKITYTSSNPGVASIDANGVVTINKVTTTKVPVTFTAKVALSDGKTLERELVYNVVYPALAPSADVTDHTGTTVKVTATGDKPTVTYVSPSPTATEVKIPNTMKVNGVSCKVTAVAEDAFKGNKKIKKVTLGSNIKVLGKDMFKGCTNLTTVTLGSKTTEIGEGAFSGCTSLKSITIPKTTKTIGKKAFYNCKKLATVTFKSGSKLKTIGSSAFQKCAALKKITIPDKVTSIGSKAFASCSKLAKVTIGKKSALKTIGTSAFDSCTVLKAITLPKTLTKIGNKAFYNCKKLATVTFRSGSKLKTIGTSAFQKCVVLKKISIPNTVTSIGTKAFAGCSKLTTVSISTKSSLTKIGTSAFDTCKALKSIVIPKKVTSIGSKAFYKCSKLTKITVKSTKIKTVGSNAFKSIHKKAKIYVPKSAYKAYKKILKKGQPKTVKFKKTK